MTLQEAYDLYATKKIAVIFDGDTKTILLIK